MCLIFVGHRHQRRYPLVIAANRDEFYARPTAPAAFWDDAPDLLAGRDLLGHGTWLGVTRAGRFAAVTNFRSAAEPHKDAPSRGALVSGFLTSRADPRSYLEALERTAHRYNGFNLLVGDGEQLCFYSNREGVVRTLAPGLCGLSNHLLDTPWPKVVQGKRRLQALLDAPEWSEQRAFELLFDREPAPEAELPDTGVSRAYERALSAIFIEGGVYGTRSSTVLTRNDQGAVRFVERTYEPGTLTSTTVAFEFVVRRDGQSSASDSRAKAKSTG